MDFFLPMSPVSIGWTRLINSILDCGETFLREITNLFAYLQIGSFLERPSQKHVAFKCNTKDPIKENDYSCFTM